MRETISVCMATYNGGQYIKIQLDSILKQLKPGDELIIVDDHSSDNTVSIIESYKNDYIKLYLNQKNLGHVRSFEKALLLANNNFVCFTDQDDEWIDHRLDCLYNAIISKNVCLVSSNYKLNYDINTDKTFSRLREEDSKKHIKNIINIFLGKAPYYGCTMMIKKEFKNIILPMPSFVEAHDLWIAMTANVLRSNYHLDMDTVNYRIHSNNVSLRKRSLLKKLKTRYFFFRGLIEILMYRKTSKK